MNRFAFTIAKNATANIVRGGASAIVALVLPHFLTKALDHDRFAAWALMLQIAAYAGYLDFGLQTALARFLAQVIERGEHEQRDRLMSTAFVMLSVAGVLAFLVVGLIVLSLAHSFRTIPISLIGELQVAMMIMVASASIALPMATFTAALIGLHRNEYPAIAIAGSRIMGALAVLVTLHYTHSLIWLALCAGLANLMGGLLQYAILKRLLSEMQLRLRFFSRRIANELGRYCSTLTIWSFAMLLITGLDVTIVAHFNFSAVGPYSLAAMLTAFFTGLNGAVFSAMLTPVAVWQSRQEYGRIRHSVLVGTRLSSYTSLAFILFAFLLGSPLLRIWVGEAYAAQTLPILELLLVAQAIRLVGNSYSTALVAMGLQRYGVATNLIEGFANLALSLVGVVLLGPIGVAWGTLIAAAIAVTMQVAIVMRQAVEIKMNRMQFVMVGIIQPLGAFLPLLLWTVVHAWKRSAPSPSVLASHVMGPAAVLLSGFLVMKGVKRVRNGSFTLSKAS